MSNYIKDGRYPISRSQFIAECNAVSSFPPVDFTDAQALEKGYAAVTSVPSPAFDVVTQTCTEAAPIQVNGIWTQQWAVTALAAGVIVANLAAKKTRAIADVDADVDAIVDEVIGNRGFEYKNAYADALAYKAAVYSGSVPRSVQHWATMNIQTTQWAADNVIATADAWTGAEVAMREHRLEAKKAMRDATTSAQLTAAVQAWNAFVSYIRGQLGI